MTGMAPIGLDLNVLFTLPHHSNTYVGDDISKAFTEIAGKCLTWCERSGNKGFFFIYSIYIYIKPSVFLPTTYEGLCAQQQRRRYYSCLHVNLERADVLFQ